MKKVLLVLLALLLVTGTLFARGEGEIELTDQGYPKELVFMAGSVGGPWVPLSELIADYMRKEFPGMEVTVVPGGGLENIRIISEGVDSVIGFCHLPLLWEAKQGVLDEGKTYDNLSAVANVTASTQQMVVRANSGIDTFPDLLGKSVNPGKKGTGGEITAMRVFEAYGFTYDDIQKAGGKVSYLDQDEQGIGLKDRTIDFGNLSGSLPHSVLQDVDLTTPVKVLSIEPEPLKKLLEKYPFYAVQQVPAGTFRGQDKPATALLNVATVILNNEKLPAKFIADFTKMLIENGEEINKTLIFADRLNPAERAIEGISEDFLHPETAKYYKSIGIID